MNISRRSLFASFGLALPALAAASAAQAASTTRHLVHHAKRHGHMASSHALHHRRIHRTAAARTPPQA